MGPYIGVTGFSKPEEVSAALEFFPEDANRKLMVGVLATYKSIRGIPMKPKWAKQTPNPANIAAILPNDSRVINLVHLSTEDGQESTLLADMFKIHELAGPNLNGFQLNAAWPQINQFYKYRTAMGYANYQIVLQIGQKAVEAVGGTAENVVNMLEYYVGNIDAVLIDPSGGLGKPFDTERAREILTAITEQGWDLGLGVAGGLGPDSLKLVEPLVEDFPELNIDAQGRLRNEDNELDPEAVKSYLTKSLQIFS